MSNYELESRLRELEREVRRLERIRNELNGELLTIASGVARADKQLDEYNNYINSSLANCDNIMKNSHQRVIDSIAVQGEIEKLYQRYKNVELANKKIRACENKKYYDFSNYRTVRKIVQGIMDNLDVNLISDKTITKSVEIQHLKTPDYWLTCVLISIMAWRNDDKPLADRAMAEAIRLDKKNSAIFYMLFDLRMRRDDAALKWFFVYQECELLGKDQRTFLMLFSLISKTLTDNVDDNIKYEISDFITKVIELNMKSEGYSEEQVIDKINHYFDRMQPYDRIEYDALRKYCDEIDLLTSNLMQASNNINILDFILKTLNVPEEQKNTFIKTYIDEIIAAPNSVEEGVYDEIEYNEMIIRCEGDVAAAKGNYEAEKQRREYSLNLITEMIDWIYEADAQDVNGQIRLNMFTLTKPLQEKAVDAHVDKYRKARKSDLAITIDDYSTVANMNNLDGEKTKIINHYNVKKEEELKTINGWLPWVGIGVGIAIAIVSVVVSVLPLLALTAICVIFGVVMLITNSNKAKNIALKNEQLANHAIGILSEMANEFVQYNKELNEYDAYYEKMKEAFAKM